MPLVNADGSEIEPAVHRTESGLIVPDSAREHVEKRLANDDWKLIRRAVRRLLELDIQVGLHCTKCRDQIVPSETEKVLRCKCTTWKLPGFQRYLREAQVKRLRKDMKGRQ